MRILIIDDEKDIVRFLKMALEKERHTVECAEDGERGSFMARTGNFDLIILDINLPKLNGQEVLQEIRKDNVKCPVIMLTIKGDLDSKIKAFEVGANDYLSKPFLLEELLMRIKALSKINFNDNKGDVVEICDIKIDLNYKTVKIKDREIYLTKKEYALLEYLAKNINKIVSRSEILEHVWDYNADPFSNSIETHIASIRRKLCKGNKRSIIHTFSGRGYKLSLNKLN